MVPVGGGSLQPLPCPTCCPHWPSLKTQSLWSLSLYLTDTTRDLALTMAASLFALLPAVLIFAFGQKYLEQGILAGAVKG